MHLILGLITALASLLWALNRLGVDVHALNPFHWHRRNKWKRQLATKPIHALTRPIEAAAVLIVGIVQTEGLVSREQKAGIIDIFKTELKQDETAAADMFGSAAFLTKNVVDLAAEVPSILAPNKAHFSEEQARSLVQMLTRVAAMDSAISSAQQNAIRAVERELLQEKVKAGEW
jgi:uncharacterized tellurite resistance protein B-like protein